MGSPNPVPILSPAEGNFHSVFEASVGPAQEVAILASHHPSFIDDHGTIIYDFIHVGLGRPVPDADLVHTIAERYMVSWFNVHLRGQTEFQTYLTGAEAQQDVSDGLVTFDTNF